MNIAELRAKAIKTIEIPGFHPGETITVKVQQPRILAMMGQGKLPNPLMAAAERVVMPQQKKIEIKPVDVFHFYELYCTACLVEPTYEEFKDIITDEQMLYIYRWATGDLQKLSSFRPDKADGDGGQHGGTVRMQAK
jgi:hypothetical protein